MTARAERAGRWAGALLILFAVLYFGGHLTATLFHIDLWRAIASLIGLAIGIGLLAGALFGRIKTQ